MYRHIAPEAGSCKAASPSTGSGANARLATWRGAGPRHRRARRGRGAGRPHRLRRRRGGAAGARCAASDRLRRPLDHAGADRLPHPSRLRRRPRATSSSCGWPARATRRSPAPAAASSRRSRRRARRRRTSSSRAALPRLDALIAEGVTTVEIKSRLRPRDRGRAATAARRAPARRGAPGRGRADLPRRACAAAGRRPRRPTSARSSTRCCRGSRRGAGRRGRRLLRSIAFSPEQTAACSRRRSGTGCR